MRYPLWAFFFLLILPPFTAHAVLAGHARFDRLNGAEAVEVSLSMSHWRHATIAQPARGSDLILY